MNRKEKNGLTEDGHHTLLQVMDKCFGLYFIYLALVTGVAAYNHQTSWWAFASQLAFPLTNLALSQYSLRLKNSMKFEIFRMTFNCIFFAPLSFIVTDGALDQYWICAVMLTLGSSIIIQSISFNLNHGKMIVTGYTAMMVIVAVFSPKPVNWYLFAMYSGLSLMLGVFITQTMDVLMKTLKRERERATELQASQKIIVEQQQTIVSSSKMSALGEMAGGVAHEINTPLAVIKTVSAQMQEILDDKTIDVLLVKEMAAQIETTTNKIAKIVQGLRSFSRDGGKDPYQLVNVHQLLEETLSFCSERFKNGGTEVIIDKFDHQMALEGRHTELSQVLLNLLNNAYDALVECEEKWIRLTVVNQGEWIEIQVRDSGKGIPQHIQSKIFQPFFTTKEIGKGTGIGLSVSSGIIKNHNGELTLDNTSSQTCFVIRLPKTQENALKTA